MGTITRAVNRLWILFSFIPYINGLGLVFIGKRANKNSWYYAGLSIEILWFFLILIVTIFTANSPDATYDSTNPLLTIGMITLIISIIITIYVFSPYEKILEENKYIKCKDSSISLLNGVLSASPFLNWIPFIYYNDRFSKTSTIEGMIYGISWILLFIIKERRVMVICLALVLISFMHVIIINYSNPQFSYVSKTKPTSTNTQKKEEKKPKKNIFTERKREKNIKNAFKLRIKDLTSRFNKKKETVTKLIEKKFHKNSLTYSKFMKILEKANENFYKQQEEALDIIKTSSDINKDRLELDKKIENLSNIIEKLEDLSIELAINNNNDEEDKKFDDLLNEMDELIDSVKHYK